MRRRVTSRLLFIAGAVCLLCVPPLPGIPGAVLSLKDALAVLGGVICLGKFLYDTLFYPRRPWGAH